MLHGLVQSERWMVPVQCNRQDSWSVWAGDKVSISTGAITGFELAHQVLVAVGKRGSQWPQSNILQLPTFCQKSESSSGSGGTASRLYRFLVRKPVMISRSFMRRLRTASAPAPAAPAWQLPQQLPAQPLRLPALLAPAAAAQGLF